MSLDVTLTAIRPTVVFEGNITHNVAEMAKAAGLYIPLWRPEEQGLVKAAELIGPLKVGLERLEADPGKYRLLNSHNGWGSYEGLVEFVQEYLAACEENPDAAINVSR